MDEKPEETAPANKQLAVQEIQRKHRSELYFYSCVKDELKLQTTIMNMCCVFICEFMIEQQCMNKIMTYLSIRQESKCSLQLHDDTVLADRHRKV